MDPNYVNRAILENKMEFINTPLLEISSKEIRVKVAHEGHFRNYLPLTVYEYIVANQLYQA